MLWRTIGLPHPEHGTVPATHFMRIVRGVTLREATLVEMPYDVLWLAGFFVVGLAVAAIRFKKRLD